jgi:phage terminase small subunit
VSEPRSPSRPAIRPPRHLSPPTRRWWTTVVRDFELSPSQFELLRLAGEALDRANEARDALAELGTTYTDRWNQPKSRPEVAIERDSRAAAARILAQLDLDADIPEGTP